MSGLAVHRSRHLVPDFHLVRPQSLLEAQEIIEAETGAVPFAGGLDIVNRMKEGFAPRKLVMLAGIKGLDVIALSRDATLIEIGAMARHDDLTTSTVVRQHLPDLAACWDRIANIRIRMQGTIAGNLLAGIPAYEGPALLSALGASLSFAVRRGPLPAFDLGSNPLTRNRALSLVTNVLVPLPPAGTARCLFYDRSLRPALALALRLDHADGAVTRARAVIGGCHAWPVSCDLPVAGIALSRLSGLARDIAVAALEGMPAPTVPWSGRDRYRERVAPVLLERLIAKVTA